MTAPAGAAGTIAGSWAVSIVMDAASGTSFSATYSFSVIGCIPNKIRCIGRVTLACLRRLHASYAQLTGLDAHCAQSPNGAWEHTMAKSGSGNFFEDFRLGQVVEHATPRTVSTGDVALYNGLFGPRFAVQS